MATGISLSAAFEANAIDLQFSLKMAEDGGPGLCLT